MKYNSLWYRKIKISVYLSGLIGVVFLYFKVDNLKSEVLPQSFILSALMLVIAVVWMNIDYTFSHKLEIYKTRQKEHQFFMLTFLVITLSFLAVQ
jgi:hypothetical protein